MSQTELNYLRQLLLINKKLELATLCRKRK